MSAERRPAVRRRGSCCGSTGAGLLIATAAIHLDLYLTGYRTIPTIGWLFLLQVIAAFALGGLVLLSRQQAGGRAGAGLRAQHARRVPADRAIRAFRLPGGPDDRWHRGRDHRGAGFRRARFPRGDAQRQIGQTRPGALRRPARRADGRYRRRGTRRRALAGLLQRRSARMRRSSAPPASRSSPWSCWAAPWPAPARPASGGASAASTAQAATADRQVDGATVLTNAAGLTLYSFAPDTRISRSATAPARPYWPPVPGPSDRRSRRDRQARHVRQDWREHAGDL